MFDLCLCVFPVIAEQDDGRSMHRKYKTNLSVLEKYLQKLYDCCKNLSDDASFIENKTFKCLNYSPGPRVIRSRPPTWPELVLCRVHEVNLRIQSAGRVHLILDT